MKKKFHLARVAMMTLLVLLITMAQTSRAVTPDDPEIIEISTASELIDFAAAFNTGSTYSGKTIMVTLMNDIEFEPTENNFTAIGTSSNKFLGTFDGGGHSISGIRIKQSDKSYQGLFGCVGEGAVVKDVVLDDAQIIGFNAVGGIVGDNTKGTISGCIVTDNVTLSVTTGYDDANHQGGIAGNNSGSITNCKSSAVMTFEATKCGSVGGIVGYNGANLNSGAIFNCISNAIITAKGSACAYFGGIVGYNNSGEISNCTSHATVTATGSSCNSFGGIVGSNRSNGTVTQCISYAAVTCTGSNYGSIAGENFTGTLSNNYYYNSTVNGNTSSVGCKGADIETNDGAVYAYIIDGDSETTVNPTAGEATRVVYLRKLKSGVTSTIMLPFAFDASSFSGTFYRLSSVNMSDWTAGAESVPGPLSANTPYLFTPSADIDKVVFSGVSLVSTSGDHSVEIGSNWSFVGVYEKILWTSAPSGEYGFSAINKGNNIAAGDFVKIGANVRIKPTRAYLHYNDGTSKSSVVLPERITVVFSDHIATPISELPAQIANTKVWSYDKTIYIESAPETNYRIIDAAGRVLRTATTHANREQISLGNYVGIVIVIINNETFKITY